MSKELKELIKLKHEILGEREFPRAQALNLMAMANNGGWQWVDPSYAHESNANKETVSDGVGTKSDNRNTGKAKKQKQNTQGDKP